MLSAQATVANGGLPQGTTNAKNLPYISRDEVEAMIFEGRKIILVDDFVLKVDAWLKYHPGGEISILHMVGRDATDEVKALHSMEAVQQMQRYRIGRIRAPWKNFRPPIQGGMFRSASEIETTQDGLASPKGSSSSVSSRPPSPVFDTEGPQVKHRRPSNGDRPSSVSSDSSADPDVDGMSYLDALTREHISLDLEKYPQPDPATQARIITKYRALYQRLIDEGYMVTSKTAYAVECCRYLALFCGSLLFLKFGQYALSGLCLGLMWHQLVFTAHDAGHIGITHNYQVDSLLGILIADFIGGLSMGWWKNNHNVHHIVTNAPEHDPDIEHMPLFAISHRLLGSLRSTYYDRVMTYDAAAKILLRIQAWTYYPFLALGRFNLYVLSWQFLLTGRGPKKGISAWHRWVELAGHLFFWYWFGYLMVYKSIPDGWSRFTFVMVSHIASSPLHVQIVLSHFAMSTADLGPQESFPQRMLRTTMDVDCPSWLDFIHGGLQFQAIHHMFPRMPRHNLRRAQKLVIEFCNEVGIPYAYYGFADGNKQVIGRLAEVSQQAAIFSKCQQSIVQSGDFYGHH
ncbi:Fatty acid/sphingolipid desaturase [Cordyceps fumosorosea ARSEF 2679]|uniref:Delta 8-(E)-sphingolipid desaturase n=1 Tax=Cordyceps fumosorosea (strain ARSEF 2679) TaxID=1081104 RepID=A0A162N100_CORFA|nr:Fatty acid/sphingolipid desaturase [Cordyceps fumosorosea ARSEF 2679]OAA73779.1 Fatty acid/sphingolipid desaturase [Cordyceps fumosorosea ARSEF 2679]